MPELKRTLGVFGAASLCIGAIIGAGIFVLIGVASGIAGPAVILSFLTAGITAFLTALSSAELSSFITEAGGSYIYAQKAFGNFWGFLVGWTRTFDYIVGAGVISLGFAGYFISFFVIPQGMLIVVAISLPILLMLINLKGISEASGITNVLVGLKIMALVFFIIVGGFFLFHKADFSNYYPFLPRGLGGILSGASIIFFAFVGFDTVGVLAEEVKNPSKNVPKAIILAFLISTLLYIGVSVVAIGLMNWSLLGTSNAPLVAALRVATDNVYLVKFISISAIFATASVVMTSILGGSRGLFAMARQGVIPGLFAGISKQGVPTFAVMITGVAIALIALLGNIRWIASVFNFGILMTYLFINLSLVRLRKKMPDANRTFKVPFYPFSPILGSMSCIILLFYLNTNAIIFGGTWVLIGAVAFIFNKKQENRNLKF
jgi:APA family basic amino acid/polyamine antiporter